MQRLENTIEEVMRFTLLSHINQTLHFDLALSAEFCSALLKPEPAAAGLDFDEGSLKGVPPYPLCNCLASALYQKALFCRREEEWTGLVLDELVNMMEAVEFELDVEEPFFSLMRDGAKTVEGRCAVGDYTRIGSAAVILLNKCMLLEVQCVRHYGSFLAMLEAESLEKVLPGVQTIEEGVQIYRKFYVEEKERSSGVLAICVSKMPAQPYISLASILSGLSYGGIQSLLGLAHTAGTMSNALPPPRSSLLSSFMIPFKPNVKSSTLTHGARALEKHAYRSSDKYWGIITGSDSDKNRLAMDVIGHLIAHCCWLNVHIVPPHGIVFEIRVADGYGARWSKDGTKFIGFLEPYMEDGHSKGWKH